MDCKFEWHVNASEDNKTLTENSILFYFKKNPYLLNT